ncbi:MAG: type III pantothenate kinase [Acidobacteriota bacterium]|nr:type III pantothenate kinase [Acidobacteriota bacterium]
MLLAIDVGNTNIVFGIFDGDTLDHSWRLATLHDRTADELRVLVSRLFAEHDLDMRRVRGVVLSSVVPSLTATLIEMVARGFGRECLVVDATNVGFPIRYQPADDVGADRLVNGVAALEQYGGADHAIVVVDFGTATTFDVISSAGEYVGGVICPGVEISADALFQRAARLPRVDVRRPPVVIGTSTVASMRSGLFFGYVAMVEGLVGRLRTELDTDKRTVSVATGGLAGTIAAETDAIDYVSPDLTLQGLRLVWRHNRG